MITLGNINVMQVKTETARWPIQLAVAHRESVFSVWPVSLHRQHKLLTPLFWRNQKSKQQLVSVGPAGLLKSPFSLKSVRLLPHTSRWVSMGGMKMSGQIHFSPLLKRIFPSCQLVKSGFSMTLASPSLIHYLFHLFLPLYSIASSAVRGVGGIRASTALASHSLLPHTLIYWGSTLF